MIKDKIKKEKGVTLISLAVAIAILIILADVIIYNARDHLKLENLKAMQSDIDNLKDKISVYYAQNGKIPASIKYTNIKHIKEANLISDTVDTGNFLVIDLSAIENLTLNKGRDFEKIRALETLTDEQAKEYTDLYIINETSHNIFYVAGVTVDEKTFYTNYTADNVDKVAVDLRYKEDVKIPDGFYYESGTKEIGILIRNADNSKVYKWIPVDEKITEIPNNIKIETNQKEDFIRSVNTYHGYYKNTDVNSQEVIYLELQNWSPVYDKDGIYKDKNEDIAYIPKGFQVSQTPGENTIDEGLVVKDGNQNEWVWIEVPKSIYITAESSEDYANIEKDMQTYVGAYRNNNYTDRWYSEQQHGFKTSKDYDDWKNAMLKSVYEKGGFYIGRYEVGTQTVRTSASATLTTPIIQRNAYPYNYVTGKQAQERATQLATEGKTTSLMFGIQWDLVLKYIETREGKTQTQIKTDSTTWGNYSNADYTITRGKYSINNGTNFLDISSDYSKLSTNNVLVTTGSMQRNSTLNIYDIAGNLKEWTLEYTGDSNSPCTLRGGDFISNGSNYSVASRYGVAINRSFYCDGFRSALW